LDHFANTELVPHRLGDLGDTEIKHALDHNTGDLNRLAAGRGPIDAAIHQNPTDALRQPLQNIAIQGIGAAEAMDDLALGPLLGRVPDVLGECLILDRRAVSVAAFGAAKIHAWRIAYA
jgi:hypothetical protein